MIPKERLERCKKELRDIVERSFFWYRGERRNDILQTALDVIAEYESLQKEIKLLREYKNELIVGIVSNCDSKDFPACRERLSKESEYRVALEAIKEYDGKLTDRTYVWEAEATIDKIVDIASKALKVTKE